MPAHDFQLSPQSSQSSEYLDIYVDQHGCHLIDDGYQVRFYWRTRDDAHHACATLPTE